MQPKLILLELNEINFEYIERYIERGRLPHFRRLIRDHGYTRTVSEQRYEELEPWIQWVTAHTGLTLAEHGVFRLGDIVETDIPQIWERLEQEHGLTVGAVCPMNAANRLKSPAFFVPAPWTDTPPSGPYLLRRLSEAIAHAVNENATSQLHLKSLVFLFMGWCAYANPAAWSHYIGLAASARRAPWRKALFLDSLLADVFIRQWRKTQPDFSSLFLNAGAHIQHHYMFSSACYDGPLRNPHWYISGDHDPVLEIYEAYDQILARLLKLPEQPRLLIATGLHQDPHDELTFYWRLRDHANFMVRAGLPFAEIKPRMSRDFLIICHDTDEALKVERALAGARTDKGEPVFSVDNRGTDLFVMLTYPKAIPDSLSVELNGRTFAEFRKNVAFVAIKNGKHNGIGYFLNCISTNNETLPLAELPRLIKSLTSTATDLPPEVSGGLG